LVADNKLGMNSKDEDSSLLNRLESMEKRLESIEISLARLVQDAERRTERREGALLVLGVLFGGLLSISVNFYTEYYMLAVSPKIDMFTLAAVTIAMVAVFGFLLWWVRDRLR
jgi:hypothetical protein